MLEDGDRIAVAVSGGQDSLSLLKILDDRRRFVPIKYDLFIIHVDLGYHCIHPKILEEYFKNNNYDYEIVKCNIFKKGQSRKDLSCFWCSWNRRKAIFQTADRYKCNKVALGHHMDDMVQTILLNLFFNGEISAMSPKQVLFNGALAIIRPLAYVQKGEILEYAKQIKLIHPRCKCPNADISKRKEVGEIIKNLEKICPSVKKNIFRSLRRIKKEYLL